MGNEKKIENNINVLKKDLNSLLEHKREYEAEINDKKKKKLLSKIDIDTRSVFLIVNKLGKLGLDLNGVSNRLCLDEKDIFNTLFDGDKNNSIEHNKKKQDIINWYKKNIMNIKEAIEVYPAYDPSLPVKEKLNNKIYKLEKSLGECLIRESDKNGSAYKPEWNYLEHFTTSTEFSQEEREILERSYKVGEEYQESWGEDFMNWASKVDEKIRARNFSKKLFVGMIKTAHPDSNFSKNELEKMGKELTKEFILFACDDNKVQEAFKKRAELKNEIEMELKKLRSEGQIDDEEYECLLDTSLFKLMIERMGEAKAYFTFLLAYNPEALNDIQNAIKEMGKYTFKELGLE